MKRIAFALAFFFVFAQPSADYIILVETSQLTCGAPLLAARNALQQVLCQKAVGRVAIGTFYRKHDGHHIDWLTTPTLEAEGEACREILKRVRPRCDSIYAVELLGALEEALRSSLVQAPKLILLASGSDNSRGLSYSDITRLAKARNTTLYALSIGWNSDNEAAQTLLKRLSGQFEGGSPKQYDLVRPTDGEITGAIARFLQGAFEEASAGSLAPSASLETGISEKAPVDAIWDENTPPKKGLEIWHWVLIGAGTLVVIGLIIALSTRGKPAQAPAAPPPTPTAPPPPIQLPAPTLRRLVVYYPHGSQEVQLPPSTAPIALGRAPDNTLVINDPTVSSRHARLFLQGTQWYIQDLGSTNGTFVNNSRVTQHPVKIGDRLRLGAIVIEIAG